MMASDDSILFTSQQLLEQNEDIIAAIVENLQIGRIDDCLKHYSLLHKNLVSLALALDNFPGGGIKPYEEIHKFPDEIMRRDVMDELPHSENLTLPEPPPIPPCTSCAEKHLSSNTCRLELGHLEPNSNFTVMESQEFIKVAQYLEQDFRDDNRGAAKSTSANNDTQEYSERNDLLTSRNGENPSKRVYRVWSSWERYTVCLGIAAYGGIKRDSISKIQSLLEGRTCGQLRSYIAKNLTKEDLQNLISGILPPAPVNYIPPKNLFKHKIANPSSLMQHIKTQEANQSIKQPHAMSKLDPRMGRDSKWTTLLGLVEGNTNEQKIDRNVPPSTSSISKYTTREPPPPPLVAPAPFPSAPLPHSDTLSPADFRVLDSIATLARGKDASATLQTPIPSIPSLSSIAKLTALPPPVMFASEILGASPTSKQQKKNPPQKVSKKQVDKVSPKSETKRKKRSTKASPVPTTSVSDEQQRQSLINQEISFLQVEEKSDTLDWGVTSWGVWGQKQFPPEAGTSITTNTDFFPTTTLQILPDDSYDYSNSNPSILRKRISKKRKQPSSSSNQNDMESLSTNSSPHDHGIPTESYHSGIGMDLPHLGDFSNQDNSMLMPIFDEFSMM